MEYVAVPDGVRLRSREGPPGDVDRDVWDRLIRQHDRKVVLSLLAMGVDRDRARELAQATWTRLFEQHREGNLPSLALPGLAIRQARFLAIDSFRHADLQRRTLAIAREDGALDGERRMLTRDKLRRALEALAACSPTAQQLFRLLYAVQPPMTCIEAARELGLSAERARHVVCETRRLIRQALAEESHD